MLIGYNNDVEYRGKEFHIQTEDHGRSTAKIESQIFHQGQILDTEIVSYDSVLDEDAPEEKIEAKLQSLLEATHKGLYKRLVSGEYDEMVGLDPVEEEPPAADPEEFEPSQDRVPTAAKQIEEEGEEAFNQFHENQAQKHVNLDDLKSHLEDQDDDGAEADDQQAVASAESGGEEAVDSAQNLDLDPEIDDSEVGESTSDAVESVEPTVEKSSPQTIEQRSPFDEVESDGADESADDLDESGAQADGAAVIESRPTPPPESAGAGSSDSSSQPAQSSPAESGVQKPASGTSGTNKKSPSKSGGAKKQAKSTSGATKKKAQSTSGGAKKQAESTSDGAKKQAKSTSGGAKKKAQSDGDRRSASSSVPAPSETASASSGPPETGVQAWNGCREPDESLSIADLVESFLAE